MTVPSLIQAVRRPTTPQINDPDGKLGPIPHAPAHEHRSWRLQLAMQEPASAAVHISAKKLYDLDTAVKYVDIHDSLKPRVVGPCLLSIKGQSSRVASVSFSRNGLVFGSGSGAVMVVDHVLSSVQGVLLGHTAAVTSLAVAEQPEKIAGTGASLIAITASFDCTIRMWDIKNMKATQVLPVCCPCSAREL